MIPEARNHPTVPKEYAGQWIAWNQDRTHIVACRPTPREARDAAIKAHSEAILGKSPPANVRMIGARMR